MSLMRGEDSPRSPGAAAMSVGYRTLNGMGLGQDRRQMQQASGVRTLATEALLHFMCAISVAHVSSKSPHSAHAQLWLDSATDVRQESCPATREGGLSLAPPVRRKDGAASPAPEAQSRAQSPGPGRCTWGPCRARSLSASLQPDSRAPCVVE